MEKQTFTIDGNVWAWTPVRATMWQVIRLAELADMEQGPKQIREMCSIVDNLVSDLTVDGKAVEALDMPDEVIEECVSKHPSFRDRIDQT